MSELPPEAATPQAAEEDISPYLPKKGIMSPVHFLSSVVMNGARTHFEEGARDDLQEHEAEGGTLLLLMTHFRRWEPIVMAQIARVNPSLQHLQYNTGITARRDIFSLPIVGPLVVGNSGAMPVDRVVEHPNETPEEKAARKERNQETQAIGGKFLANGHHWLIYPEGGSREILMKDGQQVMENGKAVRKPRKPDELLPLQGGFVHSLRVMSPEDRAKVKLLGIAVHYGDEDSSSFKPTITVPRLVTPLDGDFEDIAHRELVKQQGEDLLRQGVDDAVAIHRGQIETRSVRVAGGGILRRFAS
jgi:hypothetical protein